MPYTMPKFTAFARLLSVGVTSSIGTLNTREAVTVWKSSPLKNASCIALSPDMCASRRSSIWL